MLAAALEAGDRSHSGYSGDSFVSGFENHKGAYVEFTYNAEEAGEYYLSLKIRQRP